MRCEQERQALLKKDETRRKKDETRRKKDAALLIRGAGTDKRQAQRTERRRAGAAAAVVRAPPPSPSPSPADRFKRADQNGDGIVSGQEFLAALRGGGSYNAEGADDVCRDVDARAVGKGAPQHTSVAARLLMSPRLRSTAHLSHRAGRVGSVVVASAPPPPLTRSSSRYEFERIRPTASVFSDPASTS